MKRVKKLTSRTLFIFSCLILASCSNTVVNNSSVPEYEGMTISNGSFNLNEKVNRRSTIKNLDTTDSSEMTDVPEYDEHESEDDTLEEDIEDLVTIDVQTDDEVKYYVKPNDTFIIEIHLSNPNQYEIQSFTLNGKKYSDYMFKDGSTMELLLLETTAPSTPGYFEYTIDAIKYIDGTDIKDVKMSGDKTIKTGIEYQSAPTAKITSQNVSTTYIDLGVNVSDQFSLIDSESLQIYLSDGKTLIDKKSLNVGDNNITFNNLEAHTLYEYGIAATFDLVDGRDLHSEWLLKNTFETQGIYSIDNIQKTKTSISFDVNKNGQAGEIDNITLYDNSNGKLVARGDSSTRSFDNLLSNHTYRLYVDFSYYKNDIKIADWVGEDVTTIAKAEPEIVITDISSDKTSVSYKVNLNDVDGISSIDKVELLKNGSVVNSNNGLKEGTFTGLLSNNSYDIRVSYSYDLNDGKGIINSSVEKSIITIAKAEPVISITDEQITDSFIGANLSFDDADSVGILNSVELYKGEELVSSNTSKEINFTGLDYYTDYKVVINYSYDLNDGNGMVDAKYEINYKTSPYIEFKSCEIINTSAVSDGETIFMEASLDNPLGALPKSAVINGQTYNCSGSTSANRMYIEILYSGQFEGGETSLTIEKLTMVLDGDEYTIIPASNNVTNVFINGEFIVDSFKIVNENGEEIQYCFPSDDAFIEIKIDNKSGYKIDSFKLSSGYTPDNRYTIDMNNLVEISANTYRCKIDFLDDVVEYIGSTFVFRLDSVNYHNDYISKTISTSITTNKFFILQSDEVVEINNLDDLMNTEYTYRTRYYKLMNDIDLSGIEWTSLPRFSGIFDGNGHEIKNMTNVSTIYDKEVEIGLFEDIYAGQMAIFKDLSISNMKVLIDHRTSDSNNQYSLSIGAFIAGGDQGNYCYFENCSVKGDVSVNSSMTCNSVSHGLFIGGFIGCFTAGAEVSFNNCVSDFTISLRCPNSKDEQGRYVYYGILVGYIVSSYVEKLSIVDSSITGIVNAGQYQNIANKCGLLFGFKDYDLGYWGDQVDLEIINSSLDLSQINGISYKGTENFKGTIKEYAES